METVPSVAELLQERDDLKAKVAALSEALAYPWPKDPYEMRAWLEIREIALQGVDQAVREHDKRVADNAIYKIRQKFSRLANHIWGMGVKDYTSVTVDALGFWLMGPIPDQGIGTTPAWEQLSKATKYVDDQLAEVEK